LADIFWTAYQEQHITKRHGLSETDFEEAWDDRVDTFEGNHPNGTYFESVGFTNNGKLIEMVWRWQDEAVWPITAYFVEEDMLWE